MYAEGACFVGSGSYHTMSLRVSTNDYRLSLQLWVKRLLYGNEEGI
jgi:hypothetical protein